MVAKRTESKRETTRAGKKAGLPKWSGLERDEIEPTILKLARDGKQTATIGAILRDQYAVPSVKAATGKTVSEIVTAGGVVFEIPEDMTNLMKRAVSLRGHLADHSRDNHNARGLQLIESRIRKLAYYYKRQGKLPSDWKYSSLAAKIAVD